MFHPTTIHATSLLDRSYNIISTLCPTLQVSTFYQDSDIIKLLSDSMPSFNIAQTLPSWMSWIWPYWMHPFRLFILPRSNIYIVNNFNAAVRSILYGFKVFSGVGDLCNTLIGYSLWVVYSQHFIAIPYIRYHHSTCWLGSLQSLTSCYNLCNLSTVKLSRLEG